MVVEFGRFWTRAFDRCVWMFEIWKTEGSFATQEDASGRFWTFFLATLTRLQQPGEVANCQPPWQGRFNLHRLKDQWSEGSDVGEEIHLSRGAALLPKKTRLREKAQKAASERLFVQGDVLKTEKRFSKVLEDHLIVSNWLSMRLHVSEGVEEFEVRCSQARSACCPTVLSPLG